MSDDQRPQQLPPLDAKGNSSSLIRRSAGPIELMAHRSSTTFKRTLFSTAGAFVQGIIRFATSVLVGRIGGPAILGGYTTAFSTAQLLVLFGPTSVGSAASKFIARARGSGRSAEASAIARHLANRTIQCGLTLAAVSAAIWLTVMRAPPVEALALALLVLGLSGYNYTRGLQYGAGAITRATAWDAATALIGIAGVLLALLAGYRGLVILFPLAIAFLLYSAIGWPWHVKATLTYALRREVDGFILLGIIGTLASAGFLSLSVIVVRLTGGASGAGQYAAALAIATPPSMLAASISSVVFPAMSEAWGRGDIAALKRQTNDALTLMTAAMVGLFGALILASGLLIQLIWGPAFDPAKTILPILLLAVMMSSIGVACTNSLTSRSQRGMVTSAASSLVGLALGALSWLALARSYGGVGVAIGYLLGSLAIMVIPIALLWRRDGHQWSALAWRTTGALAIVLSLLAAEYTIQASPWWQLLYSAIFAVAWTAIMLPTVRQTIRNGTSFRQSAASASTAGGSA